MERSQELPRTDRMVTFHRLTRIRLNVTYFGLWAVVSRTAPNLEFSLQLHILQSRITSVRVNETHMNEETSGAKLWNGIVNDARKRVAFRGTK